MVAVFSLCCKDEEVLSSGVPLRGQVQARHAASRSQDEMLRVCADAEEKDKGKKKLKPPRVVTAEAAKEMLRSTAKRAKAETALHLLHAVVAGTNGAHIGLAAADVTGIQVRPHAACPPVKASESDFHDSLKDDVRPWAGLHRPCVQFVTGMLGSAGL